MLNLRNLTTWTQPTAAPVLGNSTARAGYISADFGNALGYVQARRGLVDKVLIVACRLSVTVAAICRSFGSAVRFQPMNKSMVAGGGLDSSPRRVTIR